MHDVRAGLVEHTWKTVELSQLSLVCANHQQSPSRNVSLSQ